MLHLFGLPGQGLLCPPNSFLEGCDFGRIFLAESVNDLIALLSACLLEANSELSFRLIGLRKNPEAGAVVGFQGLGSI